MPPIKPKFPDVKLPQLESKLKDVKAELDRIKKPDGSIDVQDLDRAAERAPGSVGKSLKLIADSFSRRETVGTGCSGSSSIIRPVKLSDSEVKGVYDTLARTQSQLKDILGSDGTMSPDEAVKAKQLSGWPGALVNEMVGASTAGFPEAMRSWAAEVQKIDIQLKARTGGESELSKAADHHARTPAGKEAIAWAYRAVLVNPSQHFDYGDMNNMLKKAETSFMSHVPILGRVARNAEGHLGDDEVKKFLGTNDLQKFVADKKDEVRAKVGDYPKWLGGAGLAGVEQVKDPDYKRFVASSC